MNVKKKKPKTTKKLPKKLNFDALPYAIVDGNLVATPEQSLVLKRPRRDGDLLTVCHIAKQNASSISLWDETLDQWFMFDLVTDISVHKMLRILSDVVLSQERLNNVTMDEERNGTVSDEVGSNTDELSVCVPGSTA
jgi:hypothetical protein